MTNRVIHIFGASGSGTTTLGKYISDKLGYYFMDTDDYFWMPTNPPYSIKRDGSQRLIMMKNDIAKWKRVVISGSLVDWGDELIPLFTLAIRVETDTNVRIERLRKREKKGLAGVSNQAVICMNITGNLCNGRHRMMMADWICVVG